MSTRTIVVNIFGGPCVGKSTLAAAVYAELSQRALHCELVRAAAKSLIWREDWESLKDAQAIHEVRYAEMLRLYGNIDAIVTDSPLLMDIIYAGEEWDYEQVAVRHFHEFRAENYLLERSPIIRYDHRGRHCTEEEAEGYSDRLREILAQYEIPHSVVRLHPVNDLLIGTIADRVIRRLRE